MARKRNEPPQQLRDERYRGYWIRRTLLGKLYIEKDGWVICHETPSIEAGKKIIDALLD